MINKHLISLWVVLLFGSAFSVEMMGSTIDSTANYIQPDSIKTSAVKENFIAYATKEVLDLVTVETPRYAFAVYPLVGYTAATGLEMGVMPFLRVQPKWEGSGRYHRPSVYTSSVKISTKGLFNVDAGAIILTQNRWFVNANLVAYSYPDVFWGLGNDHNGKDTTTYFWSRNIFLLVDVLKGFHEGWFIGARLDVNYLSNNQFTNFEAVKNIPGIEGCNLIGLGPTLVYDTRDDVLFPRKGQFLKLSSRFYSKNIGSDYTFQSFNFDGRWYLPMSARSVLAFQGYANANFGDTPFSKLSNIGGVNLVRSIGYQRKYVDSHSWIIQSEYRFPVWWRIGGTTFAGASNIFGKYSTTKAFEKIHYFAGLGIRLQLLEKSRVNFRIDYGVGTQGDKAFYLTLMEAF